MKKPNPIKKPAKPKRKSPTGAPKSSFDLVMERLRATEKESGTAAASLSPAQKKQVAEARRVASSRLAEREILFHAAMRKTGDPVEREKAEHEHQIDRQRIHDDCERAIEAIRRNP